jgi:polar amino acid transport system permease protein
VPASGSYAIGLLKESSVAYTIGVTEIVFYATQQSRATSEAIMPYLVAALIYVAITIPCAWGARRLDSTLRQRVAK